MRSTSLDSTGRTEIGRKSDGWEGWRVLTFGWIIAVFHWLGTKERTNDWLISVVRILA